MKTKAQNIEKKPERSFSINSNEQAGGIFSHDNGPASVTTNDIPLSQLLSPVATEDNEKK